MTSYSASAIIALASQCAPNVASPTVVAIVQTESRGDPLALNVNGLVRAIKARSEAEAIAIARRFVAAGYSVDLGLGQINSRNMRKLGLTWDTVFKPCTNVTALGRVLTANYEAALAGREPQTALRIAFSRYNTGSPSRGFRNGYVERVVGNAGILDRYNFSPPLSEAADEGGLFAIGADNTTVATVAIARETAPAAWNIFARAAYARRAALPSTTIRNRSVWSE